MREVTYRVCNLRHDGDQIRKAEFYNQSLGKWSLNQFNMHAVYSRYIKSMRAILNAEDLDLIEVLTHCTDSSYS